MLMHVACHACTTPCDSLCAFPGHASEAIVRAAREHKGALRLIGIGPLTNIALALKLEPALPELVHSLTIMGGAETGGNVTPTAEFNFFCDPEAAHLVSPSFKTFAPFLDTVILASCQRIEQSLQLCTSHQKGNSPVRQRDSQRARSKNAWMQE